MPKIIAASEANSLINPLNSPKIKPKTIGIKIIKSRVFISQNWFGAKVNKNVGNNYR